MKLDKCPICGQKMKLYKDENIDLDKMSSYAYSSRKKPEYMHYKLLECPCCHILCSQYDVAAQELSDKYRSASYDSSTEANDASDTYYDYLVKVCPEFGGGSALDIGTGNGSYLLKMKEAGVQNIVGVEPSMAPIESADPLIKNCIINDVFSKNLFDTNSFDIVSIFQTVEHIPNVMTTFHDIYSILKDNGYIYVVCHDYRSLVNRILGMKSPIYDIEHLQIFSKDSIYKALKQAGFRNIELFTLKNRYSIEYWLRLLPISEKSKEVLVKKLDKIGWRNRKISINVGNIGVIAQK